MWDLNVKAVKHIRYLKGDVQAEIDTQKFRGAVGVRDVNLGAS